MTYTDPLLKELKGYTLKLTKESGERSEVTDLSESVVPLCETIEKIIQKGSLVHGWNSLSEVARLMVSGVIAEKSFSYVRCVDEVTNCEKVKSPTGKLRLLIRSCLVNRCLHIPVEMMVRWHINLVWNWYDIKNSVLGNEVLGEIFLSVLLQCSTLCFSLDLTNSRFLDVTHILPHCVSMELVPCSTLGIAVSFIDDKALVVHVDEKSIAAEDDQIQVGDILDELNGSILHSELRGKLNSIMKKGKNKPVLIKLIKSLNPITGCPYPPIEFLLRKANIDIYQKFVKQAEKAKLLTQTGRSRNQVCYIGSISVGAGHVKMVEHAISEFIKNNDNLQLTEVYLQCNELSLDVYNKLTGDVVTSNSFMEITSCGQTKQHPHFFGYITGDDLCSLATTFKCHVFKTDCLSDIECILRSIGEGFERTHFAV